jgi:tetratricopeptide (TPR) repeat protein
MRTLRVFLSSTAVDLVEHREKVVKAIARLGDQPIHMEAFVAGPNAPVETCKGYVDSADTLVVLVAWQYGWVPQPEDGGDGKKSITWIEVEAALDAGKPVFSFIIDPSFPWDKPKEQDRLQRAESQEEVLQVASQVKALQDLKKFLEERTTRATFTTGDELAQLVVTSIAVWLRAHDAPPERDSRAALKSRDWKPRIVHALQPSLHFCGRESLLNELESWWSDPAPPDHVLALLAPGGTGKTAVTERLMRKVQASRRHAGAFVWSFYEAPEVDRFFREALAYFDEEADIDISGRLSRLQMVLSDGRPHLVVLDGLEAIQSEGRGHRLRGELEDHALKLFLRSLAGGLGNTHALITSRYPLVDIESWRNNGYRSCEIPALEPAAARSVLNDWGVHGDAKTLDALADDVGRHALSLAVLGSYISSYADGDAAKAPDLRLDIAAEDDPRAAKLHRVLSAYTEALSSRERDLMAALTAFPRGVSVNRLKIAVDLGGANAPLAGCEVSVIGQLLERLRKLGLVFAYDYSKERIWSAHPFLRQHFSGLRIVDPVRVHDALQEHIAGELDRRPRSPAEDPAAIDRYEELIEHTRLAGHAQEAFDIYWYALGRYNHLGAKLGEFTRGARILAGFAAEGNPVSEVPQLQPSEKAALMSDWGHFAKDLGDLRTAGLCHREALSVYQMLREPKNLLGCYVNLADIEARMGLLRSARTHAEEATSLVSAAAISFRIEPIEAAKWALLTTSLAMAGKVHHMIGDSAAAKRCFNQAVDATGGMPEPILHRLRAEWLRDLGRVGEARASVQMSLAANERHGWMRDVARCRVLLGELSIAKDLGSAREYLAAARSWCERTGDVTATLDALLLAAAIARSAGDLTSAHTEVEAGLLLAEACEFVIQQVRFHIEKAQIHLHVGEARPALRDAERALELAVGENCGYAWGEADALHLAGCAHLELGELDQARHRLESAGELRRRLGDPRLDETVKALAKIAGA